MQKNINGGQKICYVLGAQTRMCIKHAESCLIFPRTSRKKNKK